jgi:hypothetical protein
MSRETIISRPKLNDDNNKTPRLKPNTIAHEIEKKIKSCHTKTQTAFAAEEKNGTH